MERFIDVFSIIPQISIHASSNRTICISIYKDIVKGNFRDFDDYIKEAIQRFKSKLSRHPKRVKLLLQKCNGIDLQVLQTFLKLFNKTLRYIKHFQVSLEDCEDAQKLQFKKIITQISRCFREIISYTFEFKVCSNLTNQVINQIISSVVVSSHHLKSLHFNISRCKLFGEIGMMLNLRKITNLHNLSMNFNSCNSQVIGTLSGPNKILDRESKLKSLVLRFQATDQINSNFLVEIGSALTRSFRKLENFSLNLPGLKQIQDSDLKKFTKILSSNSLQRFLLNLTGCTQLTGSALDGLSKIISENLKVFVLSLEGLELITAPKIGNLSMCFTENLKSLESLSFNFSGCSQLDDTNALHILNHMVFNLQSLKALALDFSHCEKLTDQILEPLNSGLYKFRFALENFTCKFRGLSKLTEHGINKLLKNINNLPKLTSLVIDFSLCKLLTDSNLMQAISKPLDIRDLSLSFYSCKQVTGNSLTTFATGSATFLPKLQNLNLNLSNCKLLTPDDIFKSIKTLTLNQINLRSLTMDLRMSSDEIDATHIKNWTEYLFRNDLNHLKDVHILYTENYYGGYLFGQIPKDPCHLNF